MMSVYMWQCLCDGAILYATLIQEKLKSTGYYDDIGRFDVTTEVMTART